MCVSYLFISVLIFYHRRNHSFLDSSSNVLSPYFNTSNYRVGIPNGIPLIFKFKLEGSKLVPVKQELAEAPLSGEF
jgi:hypothetical protein